MKKGSFNLNRASRERNEQYRAAFLQSVFLFGGIIALGMGFIRWQTSIALGMVDFCFAGFCFALRLYLRRPGSNVDLASSVALALSYGMFTAVYILAPYNTMRLSLFFLLSAAAFFLQGRRAGRIWLAIILLTIVGIDALPHFATGYSHVDVLTSCLYLLVLFMIFEKYETFRELQRAHEDEREVLRLTEERLRHALEGAGDAVWDWRPQSGEFHYSRRFAEMLGYAEGLREHSVPAGLWSIR